MQDIGFDSIERVTVVAPDNLIIINRVALKFEFPHADNLHAIQWDNISKSGHIEFADGPNKELAKADYKKEVQPFVEAFKAEYERKRQEEIEAKAEAERQYNSDEARYQRLRTERDKRIADTDYMAMPDYPLFDAKREAVLAYRQALSDLPSQEGAPWDGGGDATPWPEKP